MTIQQRLLMQITFLIIAIFGVNLLAMQFYWYGMLWWFDMPMHFIGGFWTGLVVLFIYKFKKTTVNDIEHPRKLLVISVIGTLLIGVGWELFEFGLQHFTLIELARPVDSLSDLCFDLAGGIIAFTYFIFSYKRMVNKINRV